jgi:hypothetical protein
MLDRVEEAGEEGEVEHQVKTSLAHRWVEVVDSEEVVEVEEG